MELRKHPELPSSIAGEVVKLKIASAPRAEPVGKRPWESFFVRALVASLVAVLPAVVLAAFYSRLLTSWVGIGALVALEVQAAGLEGIVIWGLHRDTADVRAIGLPVFSLGAIPTGPQRLEVRPQDALESATVGECTVGREDLVLGDDDGVLFVPGTRAADIFTLAETIRDTERRQAERIRAGVSLRSQVQFDTYLAQRRQTPSLSFRDHLRAVGGAIEE